MFIPPDINRRANLYAQRAGIVLMDPLGGGKDGTVWETDRYTALKIHESAPSYTTEREAYTRLTSAGIQKIGGFNVPTFFDFDDELLALEITIVFPPFVVDFASARLDEPPDFIEDEGNTLEDIIRERFGTRADQVIALREELAARTGIYLWDLHQANIKFEDEASDATQASTSDR